MKNTRENKDITCAVRLPESTYSKLYTIAKEEGSSLSEIIRDALSDKMVELEEKQMARALKKAKFEAEMKKLQVEDKRS